jgi:16S rRNA (guanine966-N2)-methyltransferase
MRVIAGVARGKLLKGPRSDRVRPTGDKVKGAIFSLLEARAYKLGFGEPVDEDDDRFATARAWPRVLDLYAGSGALGIEALSRGAARADFVESNAAGRRLIAENLRLTGLTDRGAIHPIPAEQVATVLPGAYDVILADPPYDDEAAPRILDQIARSARVTERSVLVWEHRHDLVPPESLGRLRLQRTRRHGIAAVSLFAGEDADSEGDPPEQPDA